LAADKLAGPAQESEFFEKTVKGSDICESFQEHDGLVLLEKAKAILREHDFNVQQADEAIELYRQAVQHPLPAEDESFARLFFGTVLFEKHAALLGKEVDFEELLDAPELLEAVEEVERAAQVEAENGLRVLQESSSALTLQQVDLFYTNMAQSIRERQSTREALQYLERKLKLYSYLSESPLPRSCLELGRLYKAESRADEASESFNRVLSSALRNSDDEFQKEIRAIAASQLAENESRPKKSGCFIATAVYQRDTAPQVLTLRRFRRDRLLSRRLGRVAVAFYERIAPFIADWLTRHDSARRWIRGILNAFVRLLERP
jgi:tetratricopeptide (TPR) repeat protein